VTFIWQHRRVCEGVLYRPYTKIYLAFDHSPRSPSTDETHAEREGHFFLTDVTRIAVLLVTRARTKGTSNKRGHRDIFIFMKSPVISCVKAGLKTDVSENCCLYIRIAFWSEWRPLPSSSSSIITRFDKACELDKTVVYIWGSQCGECEHNCLLIVTAVKSTDVSGRWALIMETAHIWNVGKILQDYTAQQPRRQSYPKPMLIKLINKSTIKILAGVSRISWPRQIEKE
jgi:hypothetical protein